ncbi:MAG: TIGR03009 domain-containing protein [Gemmataceae bacterium]|nr:TIGR03009 domain-containing protein [Gemmataceae bacterium]
MRKTLLGLAALVCGAALATAQGPAKPDPVAAGASAAELRKHLDAWEKQMKGLRSLHAEVSRLDTNRVFRTSAKTKGYALYSKVGGDKGPVFHLASLELRTEGKADLAEKIVSTGTHIYQWVPTAKEIHQHPVPPAKAGAVSDDNFMGLAFGMKAEAALKRYDLSLHKTDEHWIYVHIKPRTAEDKAEFELAQLVLSRKTYLPGQLWFKAANGNEVTWDLPRLKANPDLDRRYFDAPKAPAGWKIVPAPKPGAAKPIVRPSSGK